MSEDAEEKRTESRVAGAGGTGQVGDLTDEQNEKLELVSFLIFLFQILITQFLPSVSLRHIFLIHFPSRD